MTHYVNNIKLFDFKRLTNYLIQLRSEIIWVLVGQFLVFTGGFVGIKVLTNIMGPDGYGQLALGLTIAGFINMYIYGPVANVVVRFFSVYRERGELSVYFSLLKKSHKILAIILSVLSIIGGWIASLWIGSEWVLIIVISSFYGVVSGINASYLSLQNAIRQRKVVAMHQGVDIWLRIGLSVFLLFLFKNSGFFALLGYLISTLIITVSQGIFAMKNSEIRRHWQGGIYDKTIKKRSFLEMSGYATSLTIFSSFAAISMYADRWIIQGLFGTSDVGIYSAIYQIAGAPINLFFAIVAQLIVPIIFERAGNINSLERVESSEKLVHITVIVSSIAVLLITFIAYFFSEPIVKILTNPTFIEYHNILWILVLGLSIFDIGQLLALKGLYCNRPRIYFWPKAGQACTFLVLAYFMTKSFGIIGIALALSISSAIYIMAVFYVNKQIKLKFAE